MEALASVTVTAEKSEHLAIIARALVAEKLAACVNIVPAIRSVYAWEGELHEDAEALAAIHTRESLVSAVIARVTELHPYDVPQVLALPVTDAQPQYAAWLLDSTEAG
ncbi:MAG: divalent-cation tolerance protein CutA [Nocardioides sp.]